MTYLYTRLHSFRRNSDVCDVNITFARIMSQKTIAINLNVAHEEQRQKCCQLKQSAEESPYWSRERYKQIPTVFLIFHTENILQRQVSVLEILSRKLSHQRGLNTSQGNIVSILFNL